ncbi:MAG: hypothetical protein E7644_07755, partial [Ruminococcaceae bacterium]|nr:hypothetical protein [Oscillospiraceae bacterium]
MCNLPNFGKKYCAGVQTFRFYINLHLHSGANCAIIPYVNMVLYGFGRSSINPRRNTNMMKRVLALVLCLLCILPCFVSCKKDENDKGAFIRAYLSEPIYDFDPLNAFNNQDTLNIVSLLFQGLFVANDKGKPEKALVDSYKYVEDKEEGTYTLTLVLNSTKWSDGVLVTASDVQFAFRRLFDPDTSHHAAALLYDVKNARAILEGNDSIDHLGIVIVNQSTIEIQFERSVEIDTFLVNLCSPALFPIRADIAEGNDNWAKKSSTLVCNGPFMVRSMNYSDEDGFILERNSYYYRNRTKDDLDKYVTPFRIIVDYSTDFAEQFTTIGTNDLGALRFIGRVPLDILENDAFAELVEDMKVTDSASTHVYYLNQNAEINGKKLFADANVRKALSLAMDRETIANALVFAEAADGLVPLTVTDRAGKSTTFRKKAESYLAASPNVAEAKSLLQTAGVNASSYSFAISVDANNEDHIKIAELTAAAWKALGFNVTVNKQEEV